MALPQLSWSPLRYIESMIERGEPGFDAWFAQARDLGLEFLEMHFRVPPSREVDELVALRRKLERYGLRLSQFICTPDFTHPDRAVREAQYELMQAHVEIARLLNAVGCRVTAGCVYTEVPTAQGIEWAGEYLSRLGDYAEARGVRLGFENHYRDRYYGPNEDFCFHAQTYLEVFERLRDTPVGVNFDCSNQVMIHEDPMVVLEVVKHKVWHVHASDRLPGSYQHSVVGEGAVDFEAILGCLADIDYAGYISLEDGSPEGDEGTRKGLAFIRRRIAEHWGGKEGSQQR